MSEGTDNERDVAESNLVKSIIGLIEESGISPVRVAPLLNSLAISYTMKAVGGYGSVTFPPENKL
jgi:hypothetical protein